MRRLGLLLVFMFLVGIVTLAGAAEPGCGTDPNVLLCDDFEDGAWYVTKSNPGDAANGGWCGTIYFPIQPPGAAVCGDKGAAGSACTATHGMSGANGGNMADKTLSAPTDRAYIRFYTRPLAGYVFGDEKVLTVNKDSSCGGGIWFGDLVKRGAATPLSWLNYTTQTWKTQNVGTALNWTAGRWYYVELYLDLVNGDLKLWMDDCGENGVCSGTPTLRMSYTGVPHRRSSTAEMIRTLWFENWAHPGRSGERYLDQIKVARVGPIGFAGIVTPPPPPPPPPPVQQFTLTTSVVGQGVVSGAGTYDAGTVITLAPAPAADWQFSAWSGACSGSGACTVTMDGDKSVTATFTAILPPPPPPAATTGTCRWTFTPGSVNPLVMVCP